MFREGNNLLVSAFAPSAVCPAGKASRALKTDSPPQSSWSWRRAIIPRLSSPRHLGVGLARGPSPWRTIPGVCGATTNPGHQLAGVWSPLTPSLEHLGL